MISVEERKKREVKSKLSPYMNNPIGFMTDFLDVKLEHVWPKMREVAESVRDNQLTAVPAGHSVSKTFGAARIALWFKTCYQPSTVITTAPSNNQIENQLWKEIHTAYQGAKWPLGGKLTTLQWNCQPTSEIMNQIDPSKRALWEKNFAIGFATTADSASEHATRMQGWHNKWLLVILDEACGILAPIWRSVLNSLITNERCKVLALGNPTDPTGTFYNICQPSSGWNVINVSVRDTPNYITGREIIPHVAGRDFEQRIIREYGENSNEHKYRCLGEFPDFGQGSVFEPEVFEYQKRFLREDIKYGLFDHRDGGWMPHENKWGWQVLDPPSNHEFTIGVDTAEYRLSDQKDLLSKRDYDAAAVLDRSTKHIKAIWHGRGAQADLGLQILGAAKHYNNAWINPEIPMGMGVLQILKDYKYQNIYNQERKQRQYVSEATDELGWRTTSITRQWLVNDLRAAFRSNKLIVQFEQILDEMRTFCYDKNGKPIHMPGRHDDLIFALGLALQADLSCPKNLSLEIPEYTGEEETGRPERTVNDLATVGAYDDFDEDDDDEGVYFTE